MNVFSKQTFEEELKRKYKELKNKKTKKRNSSFTSEKQNRSKKRSSSFSETQHIDNSSFRDLSPEIIRSSSSSGSSPSRETDFNENEKYLYLNLVDSSLIRGVSKKNSSNGITLNLQFIDRPKNISYNSVLKCSINSMSDNLFYEFIVGKQFINKYVNKFPCFLKTYDLYKLNDENSLRILHSARVKNVRNVDMTTLLTRIHPNEYKNNRFWGKSCEYGKYMCVMIEYLQNAIDLDDVFVEDDESENGYEDDYDFSKEENNEEENTNSAFDYDGGSGVSNSVVLHKYKYDIPSILYQVYYVLSFLGDKYTHYDLHSGNVLLQKMFDGNKYVLMRYHSRNNVVVEFKSEYIAKIIDYGKNYFNNGKTNTNEILKDYVCKQTECQPDCGIEKGYRSIKGDVNSTQSHRFMLPNKPNVSYDLRLFDLFEEYFNDSKKRVTVNYLYDDGTPEIKTRSETVNIVRNVHDAKSYLENMLTEFTIHNQNKRFDDTWEQGAVMDIYDDGRPYKIRY